MNQHKCIQNKNSIGTTIVYETVDSLFKCREGGGGGGGGGVKDLLLSATSHPGPGETQINPMFL